MAVHEARLGIIGAGYVGLTTAAGLAALGHHVTCCDRDTDRIAAIRDGQLPIFEPGLQALVDRQMRAGRLAFTTDPGEAGSGQTVVFLAVGTPALPSGAPDLSALEAAVSEVAAHLDPGALVVIKSTVPVGTAARVTRILTARTPGGRPPRVVSNPEFLREGSAIHDFFTPDRIVIGARERAAGRQLRDLYESLAAPVLVTDWATAELIKYAANAFLAAKISLINELADLCAVLGIDVNEVGQGVGMDRRIGPGHLQAGIGYGGSCFPKDLAALQWMFREAGLPALLLPAVQQVNARRPQRMTDFLARRLGGLHQATLGVLGLSFKGNTDDLRASPSLAVVRRLAEAGARIQVYDPVARVQGETLARVTVCDNPYQACRDADALLVLADWEEFRTLDFARIKTLMRRPLVVDGRNFLDVWHLRGLGFEYQGMGRGDHQPPEVSS